MAHCGLVSALFLLAATGESFILLILGREIRSQSCFILFILTLKLSPAALSKTLTTIMCLERFQAHLVSGFRCVITSSRSQGLDTKCWPAVVSFASGSWFTFTVCYVRVLSKVAPYGSNLIVSNRQKAPSSEVITKMWKDLLLHFLQWLFDLIRIHSPFGC